MRKIFAVLIVVMIFASCAAGPNTQRDLSDARGETAGFFQGLWHGIILPVSFIISLFNQSVNVYEVFNNGGWYNFGFFLGVAIILGGG
ncbi:MAG: hypothetical protein EHM28_10100, partial [Spirochaetaceae bacterium]